MSIRASVFLYGTDSRIVKWYNNRLITGHYKFDSCSGNQIYLSKALSGCVHGLGPCGLGSNPSRETKFYSLMV